MSIASVAAVVLLILQAATIKPAASFATATYVRTTTPCPEPPCAVGCRRVIGPDGCPICKCPSCEGFTCPPTYECVLEQVRCDTPPCVSQPTCRPKPTIGSTSTTPACSMITCQMGCESDYNTKPCPTCACPKTCKDVNCTKNEECVLKKVQCKRAPCFPIPTCVPKNGTTTTLPPTTATTPIHCVQPMCLIGCRRITGPNGCPICVCSDSTIAPYVTATATGSPQIMCRQIMCIFGCQRITGPDGCPKCVCPNCTGFTCRPNEECVLEQVRCNKTSPCLPRSTCRPKPTLSTTPCPMVTCRMGCEPDSYTQPCPTCVCPKTCEDIKCAHNETCLIKEIVCIRAPCFPIPTCVPKNASSTTTVCPMVKCQNGCELDYLTPGCPKCVCPKTCKDIDCKKNEEVCVLEVVQCFRAPCFPIPTCVPKNDFCTAEPNRGYCGRPTLRFTYNSAARQCKSFLYYGCTPSPNTFTTKGECEDKCKSIGPVCDSVPCNDTCYTLMLPNFCTRCICPNPCMTVKCTAYTECKVQEVDCVKDVCRHQAYCAPILSLTTECPMIKCAPDCVPGTGANGCPKCVCPQTCKDIKCNNETEKCELRQPQCKTTPCFPIPTCVPKTVCPKREPCYIHCLFGFKRTKDGCYTCECLEYQQD